MLSKKEIVLTNIGANATNDVITFNYFTIRIKAWR